MPRDDILQMWCRQRAFQMLRQQVGTLVRGRTTVSPSSKDQDVGSGLGDVTGRELPIET